MNCKQGDLAILIKSYAGNEGKIVRCIAHVRRDCAYEGVVDAWITEPMLTNIDGEEIPTTDHRLSPIRDNDGEDETLQWAPVPTKEKA